MLKLFISFFLILFIISPDSIFADVNSSLADDFSFIDDFEDESDFDDFSQNEVYDPFEKINRKIFTFNDVVDRYFFEHVARGYRKAIPELARTSIRNFFSNLSLPITIVNSLFQGKVNNSLSSVSVLLINSTIGVGGLFDVASKKGVNHNKEDFGQTIAKYGVRSGAYLVLPFFGSSNMRDVSGLLVDRSIDPFSFNLLKVGGSRELLDIKTMSFLNVGLALDKREKLIEIIEDVRENSFDPYSTVRSAYMQNRKFEISK